MKKIPKNNWLLICLACIGLITIIILLYLQLSKSKNNSHRNFMSSLTAIGNKAHSKVDEKYLNKAKAILDQLDGRTDERGFYGAAQHCTWTQGQQPACVVETMDFSGDGHPTASFRQTLAVIWARYQYYHTTGDQEQLQKMHQDLENLWQILGSDTYTLQTNRYNCFLMLDLALADDLDLEDKLRARDICRQAEFEFAPGSDLPKDLRLAHLPYKFMEPLSDNWSLEFPVVTDYNHNYTQQELVEYEPETIMTDIDSMLTQVANQNYGSVTANVDKTTAGRFMKRELLAALDQIPGMILEEESINSDETRQSQRILDYLLLTRETLSWYLAYGADNYEPDELCLLWQNIRQYTTLEGFNRQSGNDKKALDQLETGITMPYCALAANNLGSQKLDKEEILSAFTENNTGYNIPEWPTGMVTNYDESTDNYIWSVDLNAYLAGLLAGEI